VFECFVYIYVYNKTRNSAQFSMCLNIMYIYIYIYMHNIQTCNLAQTILSICYILTYILNLLRKI
jgi:hypothetical protein